jgi:drug/metabolite transporter (DMT)-like permease
VNLVQFKALTAGAGNLALATAAGHGWPTARVAGLSLAVGCVCYGLSIVLDVYALRFVGAARESAYFATAPFAGAIAAVPLLGERAAPRDVVGGMLMALGVAMLILVRRHADAAPDATCA